MNNHIVNKNSEKLAYKWIEDHYDTIVKKINNELASQKEAVAAALAICIRDKYRNEYENWLEDPGTSRYDFSIPLNSFIEEDSIDSIVTIGDELSADAMDVASNVINSVFGEEWTEFVKENGLTAIDATLLHSEIYDSIREDLFEETDAVMFTYIEILFQSVGLGDISTAVIIEGCDEFIRSGLVPATGYTF